MASDQGEFSVLFHRRMYPKVYRKSLIFWRTSLGLSRKKKKSIFGFFVSLVVTNPCDPILDSPKETHPYVV